MKKMLERQQAPLIEAIQALVRIPSVIEEGQEGYPFGPAIDRALREALAIAQALGFRTWYGQGGYYGCAEIGQGDDLVGVLGHVDVVPAGDLATWNRDPFQLHQEAGLLFGRGVLDDKGPLMAALFAAKALLEAGTVFNRRLRFIFGTDEETLWRCMKAYKAHEELPAAAFTPDADFPLYYAEKGLLQGYLLGKNESGLTVQGGQALNSVPDKVRYDGPDKGALMAELDRRGYRYQVSGENLSVLGRAAHAAEAEKGINALCRLAIVLHGIGSHSRTIDLLAEMLAEDPYAEKIFGTCQDEPSGRLRCNVGTLELGRRERLGLDIRYPVTVAKQEIVNKISRVAETYGLRFWEYSSNDPLYLPEDHPLIRTLMGVYQEVSGDLISRPLAAGGATYARTIPNCVAFGPRFPGRPFTGHGPNEHIRLDDLFQAMEIYARAMAVLAAEPGLHLGGKDH